MILEGGWDGNDVRQWKYGLKALYCLIGIALFIRTEDSEEPFEEEDINN